MTSPPTPGLLQALQSGDPLWASQAVSSAVRTQLNPSPDFTLTIYDQYYNVLEPDCADRVIQLELNDPRQALPAGTMTLDGGDWLADVLIDCKTKTVPVIFNKGPYRWSGRVDVAHDQMRNGIRTVQCELVGDKTWLDRILCWPNPFFPIFIQEPGEWYGIGPGLTVIATLLLEQAFRLQSGIWQLLNGITSLDPNFVGWLENLSSSAGESLLTKLRTPICVVPVNPLTDESAWIEINGRMDTVWKIVQQQLTDNGFDIDCTMWVPGDPQPEGLIFPLEVATCVVRLIDRSGFTGPWGPFEGLIVDLVQLEGSLLGNALQPLLNPRNEAAYLTPDLGRYVAPTIGVDFTPPTVFFNLDVIESGAIDFSIDHHHPQAYQVVVGGKSPEWINDLINATMEWLVDAVTIVLGVTGVPNTILDGLFDNVLFAFSVVENYQTRVVGGPYMFAEKFFPSGEGALTIDTLFTEQQALWAVRGYPSGRISFIDAQPFAIGREIFRGMLAFYIYRNTLYIDYVENINIKLARDGLRVTLQIGDGKSEESAATKIQRKMVGFETYLNIVLSGGNLS